MDIRKTMRVGFVGPAYPIPKEVPEDQRADWLINRSAELGCGAMHMVPVPNDPAVLARLRELSETKDVELDAGAPGVWGLTGSEAKESRARLLEGIAIAKALGTRIIRTGYGRLNVASSRFNRDWPLAEHLGFLTKNLKEAARIVEDHDLLLAIENHCDFTGPELAEVFAAVGSPHVGAALDTGNGYTVFWDPNDDVRALASYTITTHLKDMKVVDLRTPGRIPMIAEGCAVGEGNVDIPLTIETLAQKSPHARGLHLIVELGWNPIPEGKTSEEVRLELFHRSIEYVKSIL